MKRIVLASTLCLSLLALGACGTSPGERTVSGAGIGAGVGAVGGLMVGDPWAGAAIGGVVGGAVGGLSSPSAIDLGRPVWER